MALGKKEPAVTEIARETGDPFKVLISCLLSLRTKDKVTDQASKRLFSRAGEVKKMAKLPLEEIQTIIYPVGFYRKKAKTIQDICAILLEKYNGTVPSSIDELLLLPGVGRKTANLVVTSGFNKAGICVDTHVHRITNRWGYVNTKTPDETEFSLRKKLPATYWLVFNDLLVKFGQNICLPVSPFCSKCPIAKFCKKIHVGKSR